jgi:hypothetical protein
MNPGVGVGPILGNGENDKATIMYRPPNRSNNGATFIVLQNDMIFCGVAVVPIGKLVEKMRLAARLAAGNVAPPMSVIGLNSGRRLLNSSSSWL